MPRSSTITTTYIRPLATASTSSPPYVSMAGARRSMPRGGGPSSSGSMYSTRALEDASLGYVSPYPPVRPTAGPSATSMPSIPESSSTPNQDASENVREFTLPSLSEERRRYQVFQSPFEAEAFSQVQKQGLITALNERRINTVVELRRIERMFATLGSSDLTQPMTSAWLHYVKSNSLLTELRALTRNYPFSSECLDEAKRRVHADPASNRSWNYCWLVLSKIQNDGLITIYARAQAVRPEMWGGRPPPSNEAVGQLALAFVREWTAALQRFLAYWDVPPVMR